jgi:SPP1 family phage portal protein
MLTTDEIKQFIDDDRTSERKRLAGVGQRYYEGEHDILHCRFFYYNADGNLVEDKTRSNIKIPHPFFTELVDQLAAYMLSFSENPIRARDRADGLQDYLDTYFDDAFWAEIQDLITGANAKGFEYLYGYQNEDDRLAFQCADSMGVIEVRGRDTDDGCDYVIYHYVDRIDKGKKIIKRIQVHDKDKIWFYVQVGNGKIELDSNERLNPRPNIVYTDPADSQLYGRGLGFIPFWRLDNCKKQFSGLKPIKALIDDYDIMECGLSNNLADFDHPLHVVSGFQGDNLDELQTNLKTKKIIGVDDGGGLEIKTVDVPYQARKAKADEDEKNIYRFGMGFNSAQTGDGNITNIVIRSRYTLLDLKAGKLEKRLKRFLKGIIRVVLDEINEKNGTDYRPEDVKIVFEHVLPTNEQENAQIENQKAQTEQLRINTILNAASVIGDEETLKAICEILDLDYEELKHLTAEKREVQDLLTAQDTLS